MLIEKHHLEAKPNHLCSHMFKLVQRKMCLRGHCSEIWLFLIPKLVQTCQKIVWNVWKWSSFFPPVGSFLKPAKPLQNFSPPCYHNSCPYPTKKDDSNNQGLSCRLSLRIAALQLFTNCVKDRGSILRSSCNKFRFKSTALNWSNLKSGTLSDRFHNGCYQSIIYRSTQS